MIKKTIWILVAVTVLTFVLGITVRANEGNSKSVVTFSEPVEIPGRIPAAGTYTAGRAFVHAKSGAAQLAEASKAAVPTIAIDVTSLSLTGLETLPIVGMTPREKDAAITAVIQTRSLPNVAARVSTAGTAGVMPPVQKASGVTQLPQTASALPLIVWLSVVSIVVAFGLIMFGRRRRASAA